MSPGSRRSRSAAMTARRSGSAIPGCSAATTRAYRSRPVRRRSTVTGTALPAARTPIAPGSARAAATASATVRRPASSARRTASCSVDRDLDRRGPRLVLGGVVEVRRACGRLVAAGDGGEQVELDVLLRRRRQRAPVEDDLARAGLVEVDRALVAQLLELPGLEREAAGDADARQRHRPAAGGGVLDVGAQLDSLAHADLLLVEVRGDGDLGGRRRLRLRRAIGDGDRVGERRPRGRDAGEAELDRVVAGAERSGEIVPDQRVLAALVEVDRTDGGTVDDQRRRAGGPHLPRGIGVRGERLEAEDRRLGVAPLAVAAAAGVEPVDRAAGLGLELAVRR